jgi:hypothetical protein
MSTGGSEGPTATAMQPVGPAAPPAARTEQPPSVAAVEPGIQIAVFLHPVGGEFDRMSLAFDGISLRREKDDEPVDLKGVAAEEVKPGAYTLLAAGAVGVGRYEGLILRLAKGADSQTLTPAEGPALPVRAPESLELKFEPVEVDAGNHPALVVTLDLGDMRPRKEVEIAARRFTAGPLGQKDAAELKGQVAPSAALARVYACRSKTGTVVAMTQADPFNGDYTLSGLPPGEYFVRITAAGHQTYQEPNRPVALAPGKTVDLPTVVLSSAQVAGSR